MRTQPVPKLIITNGDRETPLRKAEVTGLSAHVRGVITPAACGHWKPSIGIFQAALELLKVKPEECLMIGDDLRRDVEAAAALGMRSFDHKEATVRISSRILSVVVSLFVVVGANAQAPAASPGEFVLRVDREGFFSATVEGALLELDDAAIRERAAVALRSDVNATFAVEADAAAPLARVTQAAQLLAQAGVTRIGFRTMRAQP